jgi:predicted SprT family Zn-dependent metalloprotease
MNELLPGTVRYVYRCDACDHRGEVHLNDDSHDGEASRCAACRAPVVLALAENATLG